jgi:hypothetical protein
MAKIIIANSLIKKIHKKFKKESKEIFNLINSLKDNPKKGKEIGQINNILIKELKHKSFKFYFILDRYKIKFLEISELENLIIKFVRMSNKNTQQKTINEIKQVLRKIGEIGFR